MKKNILIGSIIAVVILVMMPSIHAIQHNLVKEDSKGEIFHDKLKDIRELLESGKLDGIKHPLLYIFIISWMVIRTERGSILVAISILYEDINTPILIHPILCLRGLWLYGMGIAFLVIWNVISNILGWNWDFSLFA